MQASSPSRLPPRANLSCHRSASTKSFKRVLQQRGEDDALQAVALMQQGTIAELTAPLALSAARISHTEKIPMADSIMLATARAYGATLWSQDADFKNVAEVRYVAKK